MKSRAYFTIPFLLFIFQSAHADTVTVWEKDNGFVVRTCEVRAAKESSLKIAHNLTTNSEFVNVKGTNGADKYLVPQMSIVNKHDLLSRDGIAQINITALANTVSLQTKPANFAVPKWSSDHDNHASGQELLFIADENVQEIKDYDFYIVADAFSNNTKLQSQSLAQSGWMTAKTEQGYEVASCCISGQCSKYTMFHSFARNPNPTGDDDLWIYLGDVGVSGEDASLFANITAEKRNNISQTVVETEAVKAAEGRSPGPALIIKEDDIGIDGEIEELDIAVEEQAEDTPKITPIINFPEGLVPDELKNPVLVNGPSETRICMANASDDLRVRDLSLEAVEFTIPNGSVVKIYQGWGQQQARQKKIGDTTYHYIRVETDKGEGFVPAEFVKATSDCADQQKEEETLVEQYIAPAQKGAMNFTNGSAYYVCTESGGPMPVRDLTYQRLGGQLAVKHKESVVVNVKEIQEHEGTQFVQVITESGYDRMIGAAYLQSTECPNPRINDYKFPVYSPTGYSYLVKSKRPRSYSPIAGFGPYQNALGSFGAARGSRAHAATDLYQKRGQSRPGGREYTHRYYGGKFRAFTSGRMVRGPYQFTAKTVAIATLNDDGTASVYGEIYSAGLKIKVGDYFSTGDQLGHVKWTGYRNYPPMLHFENYQARTSQIRSGRFSGSHKIKDQRHPSRRAKNTRRSSHLFSRETKLKQLERALY